MAFTVDDKRTMFNCADWLCVNCDDDDDWGMSKTTVFVDRFIINMFYKFNKITLHDIVIR